MSTLTINFPDAACREAFMDWMNNSGEQEFWEAEPDYAKTAFLYTYEQNLISVEYVKDIDYG